MRKKAADAIMDVLNDHERKKLIIQLELLYPDYSYIAEVLQYFRDIIVQERERSTRISDISCVQLLFSVTVLLSDNNYIMKKYCNYVLEIAHEHIVWAIENSSPTLSYSLNICCTVFSIRESYSVFRLPTVSALISLLSNYVLTNYQNDLNSAEISLALQCLKVFWETIPAFIDQSMMRTILSQFFSLVKNIASIPVSQRSGFLSLLPSFIEFFPRETEDEIREHGMQLLKIMKELVLAGQMDTAYTKALIIPCVLINSSKGIESTSDLTEEAVQLILLSFVGSGEMRLSRSCPVVELSTVERIASSLKAIDSEEVKQTVRDECMKRIHSLVKSSRTSYQQYEITQNANLFNLTSALCLLSKADSLLLLIDLPSIQSCGDLFVASLRLFNSCLNLLAEDDALTYALEILTKQLPMDCFRSGDISKELFIILEVITVKMNYSFLKRWVHLSDLDQISVLEKCLIVYKDYSSSSLKEVLHVLLSFNQLKPQPWILWKQAAPVFAKHLVELLHKPSLNTILNVDRSSRQQVKVAGAIEAVSIMLQEYTKCTVAIKEFIGLDYSPNGNVETYFTALADPLSNLWRTEITAAYNELRENDVTSECLERVNSCVLIWGFLLQCYKPQIVNSNTSLINRLHRDCILLVQVLKRSDIHANKAGSLWASVASLLLFTCNSINGVDSIMEPLLEHYRLIFNRMIESPMLLLFDAPGINDGFRYSIATSINSSDSVLRVLLTPEFIARLNMDIQIGWIETISDLSPRLLLDMPYRYDLFLSVVTFAASLYNTIQWSGKGKKLLDILLNNADSEGKITGMLVKLSNINEWLINCSNTLLDKSIIDRELNKNNSFYVVDTSCTIIRLIYEKLTRKMQMQCLLYLESLIIYSNAHSLSVACDTLKFLLSIPSLHDLIESFSITFFKKEWKHSSNAPSSFLRLSLLIAESIPSFSPYTIACRLLGGDGEIKVPLMMCGVVALGSVLLYDLHYTQFRVTLSDCFDNNPILCQHALSGIFYQILCQDDAAIQSLLPYFVTLLKSCSVPYLSYAEDITAYPILLELNQICDDLDEESDRKIIELFEVIFAERFLSTGELDLSHCNEALRDAMTNSLLAYFMYHKANVCRCVILLSFCVPSTPPLIDHSITFLLQGNQILLNPIVLLDAIEMCFIMCNNREYNQQVLLVLSELLKKCSSLFSCLFINQRLLPYLQSQKDVSIIVSLLRTEESLWNTDLLPDVFDYFLVLDWIISNSDDQQSVLKVLNSSDSPAVKFILSYYTNPMEMLLTILVNNPAHSLLRIAEFMRGTTFSSSVNSELLSKSVLTIYQFVAANKLMISDHESLSLLFIKLLSLDPSLIDSLQIGDILPTLSPSSLHRHYQSLILWLIESLLAQQSMWKRHLVIVNNLFTFFSKLIEGDIFEGRIWYMSLCKQLMLEESDSNYELSNYPSMDLECSASIQEISHHDSLSLNGVIHDLIDCCQEQEFAKHISPYVVVHHFSESFIDQRTYIEIITLLLYDSLKCKSGSIGILLQRVFSNCDTTVQRMFILAFNELRDLVLEDHRNNQGIFGCHSLHVSQSESFSETSNPEEQSVNYQSPFDFVLEQLHISLEVLVKATYTLQLPLTGLLWVHSCTTPSISTTAIRSWNSILNYPSLISHHEDSFEDKRVRFNDTRVGSDRSDRIFSQCLNEHVVNNYLAVNNPYAAMAITQSGQVDQQLLIQCLTNYQGFKNTFQTFSAYSSLYSNAKITSAAMDALGIENEPAWLCWPWRQMTEWKSNTDLDTALEPTLQGLLLRLEMEYRNPLSTWSEVMTKQWLEECRSVVSKRADDVFISEKIHEWNHFSSDLRFLLFLQGNLNNEELAASSLEQQSFAINIRLINILRESPSKQSIQELLELIFNHIASITSLSSNQESDHYQRNLDISRYQMEILSSSYIDGVKHVDISNNHRSFMLLEMGKVLYQQGFRVLALNAIREADTSASSPLLSLTCRLEELLLTSSNEDESKKLKSVTAMMRILENGDGSQDGTQDCNTLSLSQQDVLTPALKTLCMRKQSFTSIALVAYDLYKRLDQYKESNEYSLIQETMRKISQEIVVLRKAYNATKIKKEREALNTQLSSKEIMLADFQNGPNSSQQIEERFSTYRDLTLKLMLQGIREGEEASKRSVYSFVSLWFDNLEDESSVAEIIKPLLPECPLQVFVPLAHQIVSRIGSSNSELLSLIKRLVEEYPFHVIPFMIPIYFSESSQESTKTNRAGKVRSIFHSVNSRTVSIVKEYESLFNAYYLLMAKEDKKGGIVKLPSHFISHTNLQSWSSLPVITATLPVMSVDALRQWNIPFIANFGSTYSVMSTGITAPRKMSCFSSQGDEYVQLIKRDEIRSDCVMQQLFELLNQLLREVQDDPKLASKKVNQIILRTYKVVSITSEIGVLEFVRHSLTIRDYLVDDSKNSRNKSAHRRYHPGEIENNAILRMYGDVGKKNKQQRIELYQSITKQITPVFHYFFLERFYTPELWYHNVQNYISTLSINSIIGYVVGLGDRHLRNILIDEKTGQLIHIDFGILFEKGRLLNFPEMVPFRLTREFVDCLGLEGIDGLLRRQMEFCMDLICKNKELILTVLGVFLHDPLNLWKAPSKHMENQMFEDVNTNAKQVLFKIENKIMRRDLQTTESVSVEKQVDVLIKMATNESNLALMYRGWNAWL